MELGLKDKTALITGSYRGTGQVIAETLASEGARVIIHGNLEHESLAVSRSIPGALAVWGELTCDHGAQQIAEQVQQQVGNIDILVNNYGTASAGRWDSVRNEDWLDMYQKNVISGARMVQHFSPGMKARGWGRIVQIGTIGSHQPNAIMPHYYAAKGALATLAVSLARELSHTGITVNTVSPGYIHTPELEAGFRIKAQKKAWGDDWKAIEQKIVETEFPNLCGRIATRQEVAELVAFLCSERAAFINGQNIRIDGGAVSYV